MHRGTLRLAFNANLVPTAQAAPADLVSLYPIFKALADETRLQILALLLEGGEYSVSDLADLLQLSQSNISRHLTFMAQNDLLIVRPHGTLRFYRVNRDGLQDVIARLQSLMIQEDRTHE
ncbi:MAG: winged helix-turn-helix transcriptional regulator [Anaerolineae bacterium]|nr:winged helix-turn-helix transcriptional regulator [Anaerolineae bacterium]